MRKILKSISQIALEMIRIPPVVLVLAICVWVVAICWYKVDLHRIASGEDFSGIELRNFRRLELLALYFPLLVFILRIFEVVMKRMKEKSKDSSSGREE